jgi:hypothetical protein
MMIWTPDRFIRLFLGLWLALAPAIFAIPAAAMSFQTNTSDDAGFYECDGCPEDDADRSICALECFNATLLGIMLERGTLTPITCGGCQPARHPAMLGRLSTPDPAPPKAVFLL